MQHLKLAPIESGNKKSLDQEQKANILLKQFQNDFNSCLKYEIQKLANSELNDEGDAISLNIEMDDKSLNDNTSSKPLSETIMIETHYVNIDGLSRERSNQLLENYIADFSKSVQWLEDEKVYQVDKKAKFGYFQQSFIPVVHRPSEVVIQIH